MVQTALIFGLAALGYLFLKVWTELRERHKELGLLFFGGFLLMTDTIMWVAYRFMEEEASLSYLSGIGQYIFMIIMWLSIIVTVYIVFGLFFGFIKQFINWVSSKFGWRLPFEDKGDDSWI